MKIYWNLGFKHEARALVHLCVLVLVTSGFTSYVVPTRLSVNKWSKFQPKYQGTLLVQKFKCLFIIVGS